MNVIEKNEGRKINYELDGSTITFDDNISINLAKRQRDEQVIINVCLNKDMELGFTSDSTDNYLWYVANIIIPPKQYEFIDSGKKDTNENAIMQKVAKPLDMNFVDLYLWALPVNYVSLGGAI